jgi:hypothetical protein
MVPITTTIHAESDILMPLGSGPGDFDTRPANPNRAASGGDAVRAAAPARRARWTPAMNRRATASAPAVLSARRPGTPRSQLAPIVPVPIAATRLILSPAMSVSSRPLALPEPKASMSDREDRASPCSPRGDIRPLQHAPNVAQVRERHWAFGSLSGIAAGAAPMSRCGPNSSVRVRRNNVPRGGDLALWPGRGSTGRGT